MTRIPTFRGFGVNTGAVTFNYGTTNKQLDDDWCACSLTTVHHITQQVLGNMVHADKGP